MNIGIDIDDTLVETTKNLDKDILNYEGGEEVLEHIEEVMSGKIPTENIRKFMNTYLTTRLEGLEVKENAVEVLNKLKNAGHKIIFITSRGEESGKGTTEITLRHLASNNVPYDNIIFSATDKAKACTENNIDIMIDDSIKHCEDVEKAGIKAILFTSMINKDKVTNLQRVENWKELEEKLNEFSRKQKIYSSIYKSPIGYIKIEAEEDTITKIELMKNSNIQKENPNNATEDCKRQLKEYFKGKIQKFDIKYKLQGTDFEKKVWEELYKVPYGKTVSYKYIAEKIQNPKAVRAVANAIGSNNLLIVIPCHRVIGSNGKLTGFSAYTEEKTGLEIKQELLSLEGNEKWR